MALHSKTIRVKFGVGTYSMSEKKSVLHSLVGDHEIRLHLEEPPVKAVSKKKLPTRCTCNVLKIVRAAKSLKASQPKQGQIIMWLQDLSRDWNTFNLEKIRKYVFFIGIQGIVTSNYFWTLSTFSVVIVLRGIPFRHRHKCSLQIRCFPLWKCKFSDSPLDSIIKNSSSCFKFMHVKGPQSCSLD